ncbi:MAG: argininosuccinate synthase, partial [Verrucomicrobiota bacterium]|nr:argininosuccinate synthase [Verrucomicrobiota bacterium]
MSTPPHPAYCNVLPRGENATSRSHDLPSVIFAFIDGGFVDDSRSVFCMKIVLAYSGGLDTSVLLSWIREKYSA